MAQAAKQYELSRAEFARALACLDRERESMQPSRAQRLSYRLYITFVCGLAICLMGAVVSLLFWSKEKVEPPLAFLLLAIGFVLCLFGALVLLLLNIPLMLKIGREKWHLRRLGLADASDVLWKAQGKERRWVAVTGKIALGLAGVLFLGTVIMVIEEHKQPEIWWMAVPNLLLTSVFVVFYFLQRGKAWLDMVASRWQEITRLNESMRGLEEAAPASAEDRIAVPAEMIERFARVETEHIVRSRASAISQLATAPRSNFSVLSSRDVLESKADLDIDTRLKVEDAIEELMVQPRPKGMQEDAAGLLHQRVQGTDHEIVYAVDDAERRVRLLSLRRVAAAGRANA